MKKTNNEVKISKQKRISICILYIATSIIMFLGMFLIAYSIKNDLHFQVLTASMHGAIFGVVILFLGIRYFFSVDKLKSEVYKNSSIFSWSNFKKSKKSSMK